MTLEVSPNCYYVKQTIETGINLNPLFKDLPTDSGDRFVLGGGLNENYFVLSGTVADYPVYGAGELTGGVLSLYAETGSFKDARAAPSLAGYLINKDVQLVEGGFTFAHRSGSAANEEVGNKLTVITSNPNNLIPLVGEEFEGNPEEFNTINRMGSNNIVAYSDMYMDGSDFMTYLADVFPDHTEKYNREYIYNKVWPSNKPDFTGAQGPRILAPVAFKFVNNYTSFQIRNYVSATPDTRKITNKILPFTNKFAKYLKFGSKTTAASNDEGNTDANVGNTIFSDIYATRNMSNPFDANTDDDPLLLTAIELSAEKSINNGQSMRIYHNWGHSEANDTIQTTLGETNNLNPQCARASLYDIPLPLYNFDIAQDHKNVDSTLNMYGNLRGVIPEISIGMNISKLASSLPYNLISGSNYDSAFSYYQNTGLAKTVLSNKDNSFLRCVAITFSNYKPKANHTTLDKFLDYGLTRFYSGKETEHIVGGVMFHKMGIDSTEQGENVYAFPIPVTAMISNATTSKIIESGGVARVSGTSNLASMNKLSWGFSSNDDPNADGKLRFAELPMNSWFTARIFTDIHQYNNTGSIQNKPYAPSGAGAGANKSFATLSQRGVVMRCIFDTNTDTASGSLTNAGTQDLQFVDIPFPAGTGLTDRGSSNYVMGGTTVDSYPNYPKHMTIWVQNFCWQSGSTSATSTSNFRFADNITQASGAVREAEVFIDNVKLKGYTPSVGNGSPFAVTDAIQFMPNNIFSPLGTQISGASGSPPHFKRAWVGTNQLIGKSIKCTYTAGSTKLEIVDSTIGGKATTYDLENCGTVLVTGANISGSSGGVNTISSFDNLTEMTMAGAATSTTTGTVEFNSTGTLEPPVNRAEYNQLNTGYNVCIGFEDKADLPLSSDFAVSSDGYILLNDYFSSNQTLVTGGTLYRPNKAQHINSSRYGAVLSQTTGITPLQTLGSTFWEPVTVQTGSTTSGNLHATSFAVNLNDADNQVSLGTGSNDFMSADGFSQKGFMRVSVSGTSAVGNPKFTAWSRRENIAASVKVMDIADNPNTELADNELRVSDTSIFDTGNLDSRYILYRMGQLASTYAYLLVKLEGATAVNTTTNVVKFDKKLNIAQDDSSELCVNDNLSDLYISPYKNWLTMLFDTPGDLAPRSYNAMCTVNETPNTGSLATGSTWNEYIYTYDNSSQGSGGKGTSAVYKRLWDLEPNTDNKTLKLDTDYGYGVYDEETLSGGEFLKTPIYTEQYTFIDISKAIETGYSSLDSLPILLDLETKQNPEDTVTFFSDDYTTDTTKKPTIYWKFEDMPPVISNLRAQPAYNLLDKGVNLYELTTENLNAVKFTWDEQGDDIWYRMLMYDNSPIHNKYHRAQMWLPLNESAALDATPSYTVHNKINDTSGSATVGSDVRAHIDGLGGYAPSLKHSANGYITIPKATNTALKNLTKYTFVLHVTFDATDKDNVRYIAVQTDGLTTAAGRMFLYKQSDNTIRFRTGASPSLESNSVVACDGVTPTSIIITHNSGSTTGQTYKLYINGVLEDTSGTTSSGVVGDHDFKLGAHSTSAVSMAGKVEEVIIYDRCYDVVDTSSQYILDTRDILDLHSTSGVNTHSSILIAADYHNFRGTSKRTIGMSQPTSWRATTI